MGYAKWTPVISGVLFVFIFVLETGDYISKADLKPDGIHLIGEVGLPVHATMLGFT